MFCTKCGNELGDGDAFCAKCGTKVNDPSPNSIRLTCQNCGSSMTFDNDKQIVACPYCGSKEVIVESDDVKFERIKNQAILDKDKMAYNFELEKERLAEEKRQRMDRELGRAACIIWGIILLFFIIIMIIVW